MIRCAIYTRKSSEDGLEQDFNSLQAQREACEAYVASQRPEGWQLLATRYDDGGYSGGTMERPGLVRLLADIEAKRIDVVVVYKVDRLTRSLADFARIVEAFDGQGVSFVSVTQSFNTTTSMGRLTLNVLLSFAQFEREVTAERIRDKIAASKKRGMWMGGTVPFGYRVANRKLVIDEIEAKTVRSIFELYRDTRSIIRCVNQLKRLGVLTRIRPRKDGRIVGGIPFTHGPLQALLRNRNYIGEHLHKGTYYPADHPPLLERDLFEQVQAILEAQRNGARRSSHRMASLLTGRIFDSGGNRMVPSHASKKGLIYRYYLSRALLLGEPDQAGSPARISAPSVERLVIEALKARVASRNSALVHATSASSIDPSAPMPNAGGDQALVDHMLDRVEVYHDRILLRLHAIEATSPDQTELVTLPCALGRRMVRCERIEPQASNDPQGDLNGAQRGNADRLIEAIARASRWRDDLHHGRVAGIDAIATREGRSVRNVRMMLNLAFLAPDLIEAALDRTLSPVLSASTIAQGLPLDWVEQRRWILGTV